MDGAILAVPNLFVTRDQLHDRQFFHEPRGRCREDGSVSNGMQWGSAEEASLTCLLLTFRVSVCSPGAVDPRTREYNVN